MKPFRSCKAPSCDEVLAEPSSEGWEYWGKVFSDKSREWLDFCGQHIKPAQRAKNNLDILAGKMCTCGSTSFQKRGNALFAIDVMR